MNVGFVIGAVVLEVGEQHAAAQKDAVVADVAVGNSFKYSGPDVRMVANVFGLALFQQDNAYFPPP